MCKIVINLISVYTYEQNHKYRTQLTNNCQIFAFQLLTNINRKLILQNYNTEPTTKQRCNRSNKNNKRQQLNCTK